VICAEAEVIKIFGVIRCLSVTTFGSSISAVFGAVSGVVVDVTQSGAPPVALLATHPAGNAGAVTPSKFSFNTVAHGEPPAVAVAVAVAVTVLVAVGVGDGVPVEVAVAVGVAPVMVMLPFNWAGVWVSIFSSMKKKLFGSACQVSGVL